MSNRCPKCNEKLSPFYMKQNCPKCNTNLVYYDLENRLRADHEKAMREQDAVDRVLNNIKVSAFGGPLQIIRFILMFSPLVWMCLGVVKSADGNKVSLISVIMDIINNNFSLDGATLIVLITMICIIIFSLAVIISSLFSLGEKAYKRIWILSLLNVLVLIVCTFMITFTDGFNIDIGIIITYATYIITSILHKSIDNKLNK